MKLRTLLSVLFGMMLMLSLTAFAGQPELALDVADDGSVIVTANGADEGTEVISSIIIGEEFPALDIITALEGDSCFSVTLTDVNTGEDKLVVIEAFTHSNHYYVPAGEYTVRFIVKNKAVGGTLTIRPCDGQDGVSAELDAMLGADDDFPIFSFAFGEGGIDEAVSRGAANSVRGTFSDETQLMAGIPLWMDMFDDGNGGMDLFAWAAVYALKAEEDSWKAVGYMLAPVRMNLKLWRDYFFEVSDVRWAADGEGMRADLEDMCAGHDGLADEMMDALPTGEEADEALVKALNEYMDINGLDFASKLISYGSEYDLKALG